MIQIELSAIDQALETMNKRLEEYKNVDAENRINALHRYLEASQSYRTLLQHRYKI